MATGLAYVGRIEMLSAIENADRIEVAEVVCGPGGRWSGVVGKGQFSIGERCLAYLQDAVVQPSEELAFLEKSNWRVRMQRFRGAPSECVIVPWPSGEIGDDLTEHLGVQKYEKILPACLAGDAIGHFPSFIPKTDEPNFQTAGRLVEALIGQPWHATVKVDGSSTTAYRRGEHFGVCSRNLELLEFARTSQWVIANKYELKTKLPDGIALQWETCGPGVQKNPLGLKAVEPRVFDAWNISEKRYLDLGELMRLTDSIGIPRAPLACGGSAFAHTADELRSIAEGVYESGKQREGIVIRPDREQFVGQSRLSFKVLNLLYKD